MREGESRRWAECGRGGEGESGRGGEWESEKYSFCSHLSCQLLSCQLPSCFFSLFSSFLFLPSSFLFLPSSFLLLKCLLPLAQPKNLPTKGKIASSSSLRCPCFFARVMQLRVGSNLCCRKCKVHKTGDFYYFCLVAVSVPVGRIDILTALKVR